MGLDDLLQRNRTWAAYMVAQDPEYFIRHAGGQKPRILWIGCADSRVPGEQVLSARSGELFVHRNIANIVSYNDVNLAAVVQYAVEHLKVQDIVVCGHYGCGGIRAASQGKVVGGYIGDWALIAGWAKRWVEERLKKEGKERPSDEEFLDLVVEENVRLQGKHLSALAMIREAWGHEPGLARLHGWGYDIRSGHIKVLDDTGATPAPAPADAAHQSGDT